jgi:putative ATPase
MTDNLYMCFLLVRPDTLLDFVGQEELLGQDGILKKLIDNDRIPSMILWGPPGCGKTTIARIISKMTKSRFVELSATNHGASDVRKAFDEAKGHLSLTGQKTIVFIDEIHRFTKAQQDLFLPYVEHGTINLIGATTENPR